MVNHAVLTGRQSTVFDWVHRLPPDPSPTTLRNHPIQSNAAEMLRLGHCLATECGIIVAATIHDAYLITAPGVGFSGGGEPSGDAHLETR